MPSGFGLLPELHGGIRGETARLVGRAAPGVIHAATCTAARRAHPAYRGGVAGRLRRLLALAGRLLRRLVPGSARFRPIRRPARRPSGRPASSTAGDLDAPRASR